MRYVYLVEENDKQADGTWRVRLVWENGKVYASADTHEDHWSELEVQACIRKKNHALYPQCKEPDMIVADVISRARWINPRLLLRGE